jgi:hypothetical protein
MASVHIDVELYVSRRGQHKKPVCAHLRKKGGNLLEVECPTWDEGAACKHKTTL